MPEASPKQARSQPSDEVACPDGDEYLHGTCWDQVLANLERATLPIRKEALKSGVPQSDVDDVIQEALYKAWRSRTRYDRSRRLAPWLLGVGRNVIRAHMYALRNRPLQEAGSISDALNSVGGRWGLLGDLQATEERHRIASLVAQAPDSYRRALEGRYLKGLSVRETASGMSATAKSAERTIDRALRWLRHRGVTLG